MSSGARLQSLGHAYFTSRDGVEVHPFWLLRSNPLNKYNT